jgi:hypothetical protein
MMFEVWQTKLDSLYHFANQNSGYLISGTTNFWAFGHCLS